MRGCTVQRDTVKSIVIAMYINVTGYITLKNHGRNGFIMDNHTSPLGWGGYP